MKMIKKQLKRRRTTKVWIIYIFFSKKFAIIILNVIKKNVLKTFFKEAQRKSSLVSFVNSPPIEVSTFEDIFYGTTILHENLFLQQNLEAVYVLHVVTDVSR